MMVPDYALIGEIMFFAYGFAQAKECGAKMVTTFKLCSEQLSAQVGAKKGGYSSVNLSAVCVATTAAVHVTVCESQQYAILKISKYVAS